MCSGEAPRSTSRLMLIIPARLTAKVLKAMHVLRPPYHMDRAYFNFSLTPTRRQRLIPARGDSSILGKRAASN
ncbi:hypothetical protein FIBSPDRAFT_872167 [Athelia psychrophila]|uniref:Uncharacterized protein n=1 Tax=Athelia psychrophila TaxID=1759441 RepID=A0A165ZR61_9AGAM|nr:hypothetical protein FIBSPDRAFT_872167 [Fibularhizoctonia sp. CBS 109695]